MEEKSKSPRERGEKRYKEGETERESKRDRARKREKADIKRVRV